MQEEGNLEAAIECCEMALSIDVHYAKSSLLLGVLYRQRGGPHDLTLGQVKGFPTCMLYHTYLGSRLVYHIQQWKCVRVQRVNCYRL